MSAFPESVWMNIDYEDGGLMEWSSRQRLTVSSQYIRADLVPQWQPIKELEYKKGPDVLLLHKDGWVVSGNIRPDGYFSARDVGDLMVGYEVFFPDAFTHYMQIPKVPE